MQADFCLDREGSVKHIRQMQHSSDKKNLFQLHRCIGREFARSFFIYLSNSYGARARS